MSKKSMSTDRLSRFLTAMEEVVLEASEREILSDMAEPSVKDVADILTSCLTSTRSVAEGLKRRAKSESRQLASRPPSMRARDLAKRLSMLRALALSTPNLSPQLRSVFHGGRRPTKSEVEKVTEELRRLGVLEKSENKRA